MKRGPKDNYFKINNELWEAISYRYKMPVPDRRVLGVLIRYTYGMLARKKMKVDREKFAEELGVKSEEYVKRALRSLLSHNAIIQYSNPKKGQMIVYGPNKKVKQWTYDSHGNKGCNQTPLNKGLDQTPLNENKGGNQTPLSRASCTPHSVLVAPPISSAGPDTPKDCGDPKDSIKEHTLKTEEKGVRKNEDLETKKRKKAMLAGRAIFKRVTEEYYSMTGAPPVKMQLCIKLSMSYAHRLDLLGEKVTEALCDQLNQDAKRGEPTYTPFKFLNKADRLMRHAGVKPIENKET